MQIINIMFVALAFLAIFCLCMACYHTGKRDAYRDVLNRLDK